MAVASFFDQQSDQSKVKADIVAKYFYAWAKIIISRGRPTPEAVLYLDLFAGPGTYADGGTSTPLLVLEKAIRDTDIRERFRALFNDENSAAIQTLKCSAEALPGYDTLPVKPVFQTITVDERLSLVLDRAVRYPTLMFVDPWGYKALSLKLLNSVLQHKKSEVIFFFNYLRINPAFNNSFMKKHIDGLFGDDRANALREKLSGGRLTPLDRELAIMDAVEEALLADHGKYVRPFRFWNAEGTRITHHLVHVTKHPMGYGVMKDIMASHSSRDIGGVPAYQYLPENCAQAVMARHPTLFPEDPIMKLAESLGKAFAGQTVEVFDIYRQHHLNRDYILSNYKSALLRLEATQRVNVVRPSAKSPQTSMADKALVTFVT